VVGFLSVFIHHDAAYKSAEKILYCFGCGWKGELCENLGVLEGKAEARIV
jgi:hypothetical protein